MRSSAAAAMASSSAATAATGSPAKRTRSIATTGRSRIAWPQYGSRSARSAAVRTHTTPGIASAPLASTAVKRACGNGERRTFPWSMRGTTMSPANCALPRSFSPASRRGTERPIAPRPSWASWSRLISGRHPGELGHGRHDPAVARAAAEVAGEAALDLLDARELPRLEERGDGEQHAGSAEPALQRRVAGERVLQAVELGFLRQPLDRQDVTTLGVGGEEAA